MQRELSLNVEEPDHLQASTKEQLLLQTRSLQIYSTSVHFAKYLVIGCNPARQIAAVLVFSVWLAYVGYVEVWINLRKLTKDQLLRNCSLDIASVFCMAWIIWYWRSPHWQAFSERCSQSLEDSADKPLHKRISLTRRVAIVHRIQYGQHVYFRPTRFVPAHSHACVLDLSCLFVQRHTSGILLLAPVGGSRSVGHH